jgi:WS/DGAT/MGAT family acyltransferase
MSSVDTSWLRMDSDGNLMMIVGVAMLDQPVSVARLKQALTNRFLVYRRFRSRVVVDMTGAWWQEQEVDLEDHVVHAQMPLSNDPKHSNKAALQHMVGKLAGQALDPRKPLWQMHLVDHCVGEDGKVRQALIIRIHHCIADGVALVGVFMSMFSETRGAPEHVPLRRAREAPEQNHWLEILRPVTRSSINAIKMSSAALGKPLEAIGEMVGEVDHLAGQVSDFGHHAVQLASDVFRIGTMTADSHTRLKGSPNGRKHVAWSEPLPLAEVKVIGNAYRCTINDVLMSSVAGAMRAYLRAKGDVVPPDCEMRAMVPVNLRQEGSRQKLGNAFGLVPLELPVGIEDPVARLYEVRRRMAALKGSYTALVAMSMLGVLGATPKQVQNEIQNYFARKATMVMSNVPGPRKPLYLAGGRLDQIMFWVPQSGDIGVGVSILSYNGGVQFGIETDDAIADDPSDIIRRFAPEFEKLVLLALMADADFA